METCGRLDLAFNNAGGAIVTPPSTAGHVGLSGASLYVASKHAVEGLTKTVALGHARQNIRVNAVAPGVIQTEGFDRFAGNQEANKDSLASLHPAGRAGAVDDIARGVLCLLDPANAFVTGASPAADGGFLAR